MEPARDRKRDPHHCLACGASFDVTYYDDRAADRTALPGLPTEVSCPSCGRPKSVAVPAGAERTLRVELDPVGEAEEGGGG